MSVKLMDNRIVKTQENENDLAWQQVLCELHKKFGEAIFKSWFSKITLISILGKKATLGVPTQFIRDWIKTNYQEQILKIFSSIYPEILSIELLITHSSNHSTLPFEPAAEILEESKSADVIFTSQLDPRFTFKNFVVGSPNELAYAASWAVAESKESIKESNPLFLYGGVGLGKTHLMHAIAWHIKITNPKRKVIYMSAEKFMYKFVSALRNKDVMSFKEQFRSIDVLMIDDIQFICGKESTQEEFFHTFNALIDNNRQMVISCDRSPTDLDNIEDRIKSRLGWGLVADVHSTTYELRLGILASKIEQLGVSVPQNVIEFLASKIVSNVRELEGALNKVIAHSKLVGRNITIESCQSILKDLLRSNEKYITIEEIQKKVAERYNIKVSDMSSTRRIRSIARPRQIAMYLAKSLTTKSLNDIGKLFGKKDHTTVMHACKQVEKLKLSDKGLEEEISLLARVLQG